MVYVISSTREYSDGPRSVPTESEDKKFRSNAELDKYAEDNNLCIVPAHVRKARAIGRVSYRYQPALKEVLEVELMRNIEGLAREVQEKHSEYSWVKCLRIAKKALQKKEKGNGKKG